MPDRRAHRGPHPEDAQHFTREVWPSLSEAMSDLSWLLTRGYAEKSSLKLVGDRFALVERQRIAVMRCACSDFALARRRQHEVTRDDLRDQILLLDGYNVLTTVEAALAGGVILEGRDGCYRDMASMHGTFRKVAETEPALDLIGSVVGDLGVSQCVWYLDRPVSNSGRLKGTILGIAERQQVDWQVEVVPDPDAVLAGADEIVASADSMILDHCGRWFNLAAEVIKAGLPDAEIVRLGG